jgi:hypothetical protein
MSKKLKEASNLVILRGLLQDEIIDALTEGETAEVNYLLAQHFRHSAAKTHSGNAAADYALELLLTDENYFSCQAAKGAEISEELYESMAQEIAVLQSLVSEHKLPAWLSETIANGSNHAGTTQFANWSSLQPMEVAHKLANFYRRFGFGYLSLYRIWRWDGRLCPVEQPDDIRLTDLVGYQSQKDEVMTNTRLFLQQGRGNNMLLYGARGTGKSSLIKAVTNELADEGLCLVELPLDYIAELPQILELLREQPRHYIIFIDDLSFEKADQSYKITKAVLEGSVSALGGNVLIYATSNRRHLIVENWQDREGVQHNNGEVRASDSMSEKLSLADRFGQTVLFTTPNQDEYLNIVTALAAADGIDMPETELRTRALQWALWQNGCSGRTARQFVNSLNAE